MLTMLPLQNSPDTLTVRARDIIRATGHAEAPADVAFRFQTEDGFVDYFRKSLAGTKASTLPQWKQILDVNPYPMSFWYRESPAPLLAERSLSRFRRVSLTDPAPVVPGMVSVVVDLEGRLLRFAAAADPTAPIDRAAMEPDWSPFFAAAGLDMSRFSGATPDSTRVKPGPGLSRIAQSFRSGSRRRLFADAPLPSTCGFHGPHRMVPAIRRLALCCCC
jgi:hypothetical protein